MKTIKDMPEHARPREKLKEKGPQALTDEELVAAILENRKLTKDYLSFQEAGLLTHQT